MNSLDGMKFCIATKWAIRKQKVAGLNYVLEQNSI